MTDKQILKSNILVDLDAVFDSRLAFLFCINEDLTVEIAENGSYLSRKKDNFGDMSNDIFMPMYRARTKAIMEYAIPTPMMSVVKNLYGDLATNIKTIEYLDSIVVYVNTFPYSLTIDEQENITEAVSNFIPDSKVLIVNMSHEDLTPAWVKDNVNTIIKYDGMEWLEYHIANANLINTPLLDTTLVAPAIISGSIPSEKINKDLYTNVMASAGTVINLNLVDASQFSALLPEKKPTNT